MVLVERRCLNIQFHSAKGAECESQGQSAQRVAPGLNEVAHQPARGTTGEATNVLDELINRVVQAIEDEGEVLIDAANRIRTELLENSRYETLTLGDVLKKLVAIVIDALLNTTENLVDLLIDIFVLLARAAVSALDTPIWIPVVSDILEDFGVKIQFSILDVVCMIGAIPATLIYKGIFHRAPFSASDGFSDKIINSKDVYALKAAFASVSLEAGADAVVVADISGLVQPMAASAVLGDASPLGDDKKASDFVPVKIPKPWQSTIYMVGHLVGGIVSIATAILVMAEAKKGSISLTDGRKLQGALTADGIASITTENWKN